MRLLFATTNKAKLAEALPIGAAFGAGIEGLEDFMTRTTFEKPPAVAETGTTYEENARYKARSYSLWSGITCVADDSGLEVDSLGNLPGVYTAGFGFSRVRDLLVPNVHYKATFRCRMCLVDPRGRTVSVEDSLDGFLAFPKGAATPTSPVPYSNFFTPVGETRTLATLTAQGGYESHRAKALTRLLRVLGFTYRAGDPE
jgi:XTP/dITP diphosphohydrolase